VSAVIPTEPAPKVVAAAVAALAATVAAAMTLAIRGRRRRAHRPEASRQVEPDEQIPVLVPYNYELEESLTG
jgi:hypothetical protein